MRTASVFVILTALCGAPALTRAADTLTGEIVDLACYLPHPAQSHGASHKKCAETCLKKGMPIGLLTADKQLYVLLEDHENAKAYGQLKDHAADTVTVEGEKVAQGGTQGFVVEAVK